MTKTAIKQGEKIELEDEHYGKKPTQEDLSKEIELHVNSVQVNVPCGICGNRCNDNDLDFFTKDNGNQVCGQCALIYAPDLVVQQKLIESQAEHAARGSPEDKQLGVYWAYLHDWVEKQKEMKLP